jgi:DNA polymerase-4
MLWIGKSTANILKQNGINTIGDMANKNNEQVIKQILNKNWYVHIQHANGIGDDELNFSQGIPKSISSAKTFLNDTDDFVEITNCLKTLTYDVVDRLKKHNLLAKTITVYVKTTDFVQHNKSYTLNEIINDEEKIWVNVIKIFQTYFLNKVIRLVGVKLDNLFENEINLFSSEIWNDYKTKQPDKNSLVNLINEINEKFERKILDIASNKIK